MNSMVKEQVKHVPTAPGVYIFRDSDGTALYVGKAKNLKNRVKQYFTGEQHPRTALFQPLIRNVETIVAGTEKEALLLENTLIKRYRPPFNVDMKDDKSYPCFKVTIQEEFPRLEITRKLVDDKSLYFGPFTDAGAARATLAWLEKAFPLRRCRKAAPGGRGRPGRPCLDFQMERCLGPCSAKVNQAQYSQVVDELVDFLRGNGKKVVGRLRTRMRAASKEMAYETAANLRDRISAIETVLEKQDVVGDPGEDMDVLGFERSERIGVLTCLFIRSGMLVGRLDTVLRGVTEQSQALETFLSRHYKAAVPPPPVILCPEGLEFGNVHEELLTELAGRKTSLKTPVRGRRLRLVRLAGENASQALRETLARESDAHALVSEVRKALKLETAPERIECVDISHTAGKQTFGATVAWERGRLVKDQYRLFKISGTVTAGDDYAALAEVIKRRFTGSSGHTLALPDLLLVDGGKGQLSRIEKTLSQSRITGVNLAAISKARAANRREEGRLGDEIFIPGRANPVKMKSYSSSMHLLQMLRDEAHRFVLSSHRRKRGSDDLLSRLDGIPGVGPARRTALLNHFRSIEEIRIAPVEEIASVRGLNQQVAIKIKERLQ